MSTYSLLGSHVYILSSTEPDKDSPQYDPLEYPPEDEDARLYWFQNDCFSHFDIHEMMLQAVEKYAKKPQTKGKGGKGRRGKGRGGRGGGGRGRGGRSKGRRGGKGGLNIVERGKEAVMMDCETGGSRMTAGPEAQTSDSLIKRRLSEISNPPLHHSSK